MSRIGFVSALLDKVALSSSLVLQFSAHLESASLASDAALVDIPVLAQQSGCCGPLLLVSSISRIRSSLTVLDFFHLSSFLLLQNFAHSGAAVTVSESFHLSSILLLRKYAYAGSSPTMPSMARLGFPSLVTADVHPGLLLPPKGCTRSSLLLSVLNFFNLSAFSFLRRHACVMSSTLIPRTARSDLFVLTLDVTNPGSPLFLQFFIQMDILATAPDYAHAEFSMLSRRFS